MSDAALVDDTGTPDAGTGFGQPRGADGKFAPKAADTAPAGAPNGAANNSQNGKTIAGGAETVVPAAPQDWPNDWQDRIAKTLGGEDAKAVEKIRKQVGRYASPVAVWEKAAELEAKLSAGGLTKIPGPKATDEERAAFYKALGVPEKPEDYAAKLKLANGRVLGEGDKQVFDYFATKLHGHGVTPAGMSALTDAWLDYQQAQSDQRQEDDQTFQAQSETALRKEWGGDYKKHEAQIATLYESAPPAVRDLINGGRDAQGNRLGDNVEFVRWLHSIASELYSDAQNYGSDGTTPLADQIEAFKAKAAKGELTAKDREDWTNAIDRQLNSGKRRSRAA